MSRPEHKVIRGDLGLALLMRDTVAGLEEFMEMFNHSPWRGDMKIVSIDAPGADEFGIEPAKARKH